MDPFSHLLLGYLLGFGIFGAAGLQYVVAAAIGGALPDADVAFYPLSQKFPILRHRGISHSIVGVTIIASVGCFVIPKAMAWGLGSSFSHGTLVLFFLALEVGGLSHVFLDSLDHWSVPIFAPFSPTEYKFDVDRIVNVGSMAFTVFAYGLLVYERGRISLELWGLTTYLLLAAAAIYFVVRILGRALAGVAQRREAYSAVIPQGNPLRFVFFREERSEFRRRLEFAPYHLLRGFEASPRSIEVPLGPRRSHAYRGRARGPAAKLHYGVRIELDPRRDSPVRRGPGRPRRVRRVLVLPGDELLGPGGWGRSACR